MKHFVKTIARRLKFLATVVRYLFGVLNKHVRCKERNRTAGLKQNIKSKEDSKHD